MTSEKFKAYEWIALQLCVSEVVNETIDFLFGAVMCVCVCCEFSCFLNTQCFVFAECIWVRMCVCVESVR